MKAKIEHYKHLPQKKIATMKILGWFVMMLGPFIFFYKYPDNTPFSLFIEFLLILFGLVILKDCWISQQYWRNESEKIDEVKLK